ncbi:hypothetical protein [Azospirillum argentinense]|uniref:SAM-dependent DNA methyltransferase n=1 Tax=Azospirillum argentinense TaxID=2970906 RepID=UPI0032DFF81E
MTQNRSHAVMAQRHEPHDSLDFFPTPPWATRALCVHVLPPLVDQLQSLTVWEPACGTGAMALPLEEHFGCVLASDVHPYGFGEVLDFLMPFPVERPHWIVTNPPFRLGIEFARRALDVATDGVALLVRTAFLEGVERSRFFAEFPPAVVAQFAERVPMVKGRLDRTASTATSYTWIIWAKGHTDTRLRWIPPCRKALDRDSDWPAEADAPATLEDTAA